MQRSPSRAFTLIELLVVVAVVSILAALVVPLALQSFLGGGPEEGAGLESAFDSGEEDASPPRPEGRVPAWERMEVDLQLHAREQRQGISVRHHYELSMHGRLRPAWPDRDEPLRVVIPLPEGDCEVQEARLERIDARGIATVLPDTRIRDGALCWVGERGAPGGDRAAEFAFSFQAQGADLLRWSLPEGVARRGVELRASVLGLSRDVDTGAGLPCTVQDGSALRWSFDHLVSARPLVIELPPVESPLSRAVLLFRWAGLAVLVFGAGFWYLGELLRPGRLDGFRWGHFLLLALTQSFFFVAFGVFSFEGLRPAVALAGAALLSLPLLVVHLRTIVDLRFALSAGLPLSIYSIAVVVNAVYGGALEASIDVGLAFVAVATLTLGFGRLQRQRRGRDEAGERALDADWRALDAERERASAQEERAGALLREADASACTGRRRSLEEAVSLLRRTMQGVRERGVARRRRTILPDGAARRRSRRDLRAAFAGLRHELAIRAEQVEAAAEGLLRDRAGLRERSAARPTTSVHCPSCGHRSQDAPFCAGCGKPSPRRLQCAECEAEVHVPLHLLRQGVRLRQLHCMSCGQRPEVRVDPAA